MREVCVGRVGALVCSVFVALCLACQRDQPSAPAGLGVIVAVRGDDQQGIAGEPLDTEIAVRVVNANGDAVRGVRVIWALQDSGAVDPPTSVSAGDGTATVRWRLGPNERPQHLVAFSEGFVPATIRAVGNPHPLGLDIARLLSLDTYDGSGQTVHPDFLPAVPGGAIRTNLLAITPYPFGNSAYENPAVYTSSDWMRWAAPFPALNPVITPDRGYLSDPDLVYDPVRHEVRMYYRQVERENEIMMMRSRDGVAWGTPVRVAHAANHEIISPSIVRRGASDWLMWSVNGKGGCVGTATTVEVRHSSDGEQWDDPAPVELSQAGFSPWHIEVQWIPARAEYWALYNVKTLESCATPALFLATSSDGVRWKTYPSPVLARGEISALNDIVYRSSFDFDPTTDVVTFFFSGARYERSQYVWRSVVQRRHRNDVFNTISTESTRGTMALRANVPPLLDPP